MFELALDDDVTALDQPDAGTVVRPGNAAQHIRNPGPGGIDQHIGSDGLFIAACKIFQNDLPDVAVAPRADAFGTGLDFGTAISRIARIQNHQSGIVHPAIRIFEPLLEELLEPCENGG